MQLQGGEENTSESTGRKEPERVPQWWDAPPESLNSSPCPQQLLSYLRLFNENDISNVWIRTQNDSYFPQTSSQWILPSISYNMKLYFVPRLPQLTSPFFSLYTRVTPAMGWVLSSLPLFPSPAYSILYGDGLWPLAPHQAADGIS